MGEDPELKKIRHRKLRELVKDASESRDKIFSNSGSKPVELTDRSFTEIIKNYPLVVVDCWAAWCTPCKMIAPVIEDLARDYAGKIFFGKLNVDENSMIPMQYQIMSIPTLLVFKNGKLVDRIVGAMSRQMLEPKITRYLQL